MHSSTQRRLRTKSPLVRVSLALAAGLFWAIGNSTAFADKPVVKRATSDRIRSISDGGVAACTDGDGDGYGTGDTCAGPDCDDGNANIHPGAPEKCNGVDDNCDGVADEGFTVFGRDGTAHCQNGSNAGSLCKVNADCPGGNCAGDVGVFGVLDDLPLGRQCVNGLGICARVGEVVCKADETGAECDAVPGPADPAGEGLDGNAQVDPTVASCFDHLDNDCDGLTDHGGLDENDVRQDTDCTTPELCDGFDNDNNGLVDDGFDLGAACTVGDGPCKNAGIIVCKPDGTAGCNVSPLAPGVENTPGGSRCTDGVDNDCDGAIDLADTGCQAPEKCDGLDNDGNGSIDEGFPVGDACSVGVGACQNSGTLVCSPDGTGTICNAVAFPPTAEQPIAGLCGDGIDNDCDGFTDDADSSCGSSDLMVQCALPYFNGKPGNDCTGKHIIRVFTNGGPGTVVTTELLALDPEGAIIQSMPANHGEEVHMASRISPDDFKMHVISNRQGNKYEVFAPVPMLRVTAQNQNGKAQAFCSNIPFLQVIQPSNTVVSGDITDLPVQVSLPRINPKTLAIKIDGIDIVAGLGLDPVAAFPGGPYSGSVNVNGDVVNIENLIVDSAAINVLSSNSLTFKITGGLGCGSHIVLVTAERARDAFKAKPGTPSSQCLVDDLNDKGIAMVFKIEVTEPMTGDVTPGGPTQVVGTACHGAPITEADINGFDLDVSGQVLTPGNGTDSGDKYTLDFAVDVPVTNLREGIAASNTTGSFDPGSNLLVARAMDGNFNTVFDSVTFAVGPIVPAPPFALTVANGDPANFVQTAFVMGINTTGITHVFTAQKDSNSRCIKDRTKRKLREQNPPPRKIDVECDPEVSMTINGTEFQKDGNNVELDITLTVDPNPDQVDVRLDLPPIDLQAHFGGYCESGCVCAFGGCLCAVCVTVDVNAILVRKNMNLTFSVTEDRILQSGVPKDQREPLDFNFDVGESNPDDATRVSGEVDIGCVLGFFLDIVDFFVTVFTLGFVDIDLDILDFEITGDDMKDRFDSLDGDPMDLDIVKMKNDEEALDDFDTKQRDTKLTGCEINDNGLAVAIGSAFEPREDKLDPEARPIPGTPLKNAPVPQPPISDFIGRQADDLTIALSDDVFNQLFYNMTQTGKLKTEFTHVRELREFMPDDCNTIADDSRRARCIGWKTQDCSAFPGRSCSPESLNAGESCLLDAACHTCAPGSPNAGQQCIADLGCGQVCSAGSAHPGQTCTLNAQCNGCSPGSTNAGAACTLDIQCGQVCSAGSSNPGATCTLNVQCPGGTCDNSGTCDTAGTCDTIADSCDNDGTCLSIDPLRRSCVIGKLLAQRFNVRPDTQMIIRAKIDEAPKVLIDDDPECPPGAAANDPCRTTPVDLKLHISNATIAMIADRNNNSLVDGDEATLPVCNFSELNADNLLELENEPAGTIATDCLMFLHCLKIDVNFAIGMEEVNGRKRMKLNFNGIDRENTGGYQCGGSQSLPELDFFNDRAGRDGTFDLLEGNIRDNTPPMAPEGAELGGNVRFEIDRILAIRTRPLATCAAGQCVGGFNNLGACTTQADCEDFYQDFIGLTGHTVETPGPNPPCPD